MKKNANCHYCKIFKAIKVQFFKALYVYFVFLQIIHEEREARKDELMNSGFNLTRDKVLNTDYFKVMFKFTLLLSKYAVTELK